HVGTGCGPGRQTRKVRKGHCHMVRGTAASVRPLRWRERHFYGVRVNPFRVIAIPLLAGALFVEVYALVIQGATDACSFGYCALGHGGTVAAPHGLAALAGVAARP